MELKLETIFNLLRLDEDQFEADPTAIEDDNSITIFLELKNEKERKCPHCKSHNVVVKDILTSQLNFSLSKTLINRFTYLLQREDTNVRIVGKFIRKAIRLLKKEEKYQEN